MTYTHASVIIPVHNGSEHLSHLWESLQPNLTDNHELIVVDDGSTEDIASTLRKYLPGATLLHNQQPNGYAGAVNKGLEASRGYHKLLLNSDLILKVETLSNLLAALDENPSIGVVGAKLLYPQTGTLQHYGLSFTATRKFHVYTNAPASHSLLGVEREVQAVTFALVGINGDVYSRVGMLDEAFYNGSEDIDYCFKVRSTGYGVSVDPRIVAYHWEGRSGEARHSATSHNDNLFWSRWGGAVVDDFPVYLRQSWEALIETLPRHLSEDDWIVLNFSREPPGNYLQSLFTDIADVTIRSHLRVRAATLDDNIWLPLALPGDLIRSPLPFIYLVDRFTQLNCNAYWFEIRSAYVDTELVVDSYGNCLPTTSSQLSAHPVNLKHVTDKS